MLLHHLREGIKSVAELKDLTQNLSSKTNTYRALKTPKALKGVQGAEDKIEKALDQK